MSNTAIWKMRDGTRIPVSEMADSHLLNAMRMLDRNIASYPGEQVYIGESEYAEDAVEQENRANLEQLERITRKRNQLHREAVSRGIIEPQRVRSSSGSLPSGGSKTNGR